MLKVISQYIEFTLELRCADDRGAGYKNHNELTLEDVTYIEDYEETRKKQQLVKSWADKNNIGHFVTDSDDQYSRHSDAYLYFPANRIQEVAKALNKIGLEADILDVPADYPLEQSEQIRNQYKWEVERRL